MTLVTDTPVPEEIPMQPHLKSLNNKIIRKYAKIFGISSISAYMKYNPDTQSFNYYVAFELTKSNEETSTTEEDSQDEQSSSVEDDSEDEDDSNEEQEGAEEASEQHAEQVEDNDDDD